jgi:hypothetical protein
MEFDGDILWKRQGGETFDPEGFAGIMPGRHPPAEGRPQGIVED